MSNTRQNIGVNRFLTSVLHSIPRLARFVAAGAIVLAMAMPVGAAAVTWDAGGSATNLYWSNGINWNPDGVPGSTSDVTFTGTYTSGSYSGGTSGSSSTVTNEVNANITINTLTYSQLDGGTGSPGVVYHNTKIDPGATLKISGTYTVSSTTAYGIPGPYSLYAVANIASPSLTTKTIFSGGGALDVSTSSGGNTGGDIVIRELASGASGNNGTQTAELDLSGLSSFNANVDALLVGYSSAANGTYPANQRATGTLYLAQNNTLTLNSTVSSGFVGLVIGYDSGAGI